MIVFDLRCEDGHAFEAWFARSSAYDDQRARHLIACPFCASTTVEKAAMAPRLNAPRAEAADLLPKLAAMQKEMLKGSTWVGDQFATKARAMADGAADKATIHGSATPTEARALRDDGIGVMPLPFPVVPPEQAN